MIEQFIQFNGKFYWRGVKSGTVFGGPFDTLEEVIKDRDDHLKKIYEAMDYLSHIASGGKVH